MRRLVLLFLTAPLLLTACGSGPSSSAYLYVAPRHQGLLFLQWQPTQGSEITGTGTFEVAAGFPPDEQLQSQSFPLTGSISGGSVIISITSSTGQISVSGNLSGDRLILNWPSNSGTFQPGTLTQADVSAFNTAAKSLSKAITTANLTAGG
jgi:hypothetical protein